MIFTFKIFCGDCKAEYKQICQDRKFKPIICAACGSDWIAVKQLDECKRCGSEINRAGFCSDLTCPFSHHKQDCDAGWYGHPEKPGIELKDCTCGF